jgi:hypothetical protein
MKTIKIIDLGINISLLLISTIENLLNGTEELVTAYLWAGAWQSLSMIVHASCGWMAPYNKTRYAYHWIAFIAVITMPLGSIWILLFAAPFMALFYTILCVYELKYLYRRRPLSLLK